MRGHHVMGGGWNWGGVLGVVLAVLGAASAREVLLAQPVQIPVLMSYTATPYREVLAGVQQYFRQHDMQVDWKIYPLEGEAAKAAGVLHDIELHEVPLLLTLGNLATQVVLKDKIKTPLVSVLVPRADALDRALNATGVVMEFPVETQLQWLRRLGNVICGTQY